MIIFPAIDLRDGKCVRLLKGDFSKETIFSDKPVEMALAWEKQGAEYLHLVDLDGAKNAEPQNLAVVQDIVNAVHIPVELGGGIRSMATIDKILGMGVARVILGSVAVHNPQLVKEACQKYPNKIVAGIDAVDGIVAVDGWCASGHMKVDDLARKMVEAGITTIIFTDISRDGTLSGVNAKATAALAKDSGAHIIASGGVRDLSDIKQLKAMSAVGIEGVITGQAIYTGRLDLRKAIALAAEEA